MDIVTGSEKNSRYGLAWKTNNKAAKEKIFDLKKTHKNCVLVTDNSGKELNNLFNILKKYNYEVAITQNEEKALKIFRKKRFDFLISVIPGMVGVDFLGKIKTLAPETEVLIVTELELLESSLEKITSGAFAYQKELNKTQILDKNNIKDFLQNEFRLLAAMDYYLERYSL
jgi:DNA-binding NtrC family response regulator